MNLDREAILPSLGVGIAGTLVYGLFEIEIDRARMEAVAFTAIVMFPAVRQVLRYRHVHLLRMMRERDRARGLYD